jgi:cobalt-zinc-cadmium efflux system membrane fusion protein
VNAPLLFCFCLILCSCETRSVSKGQTQKTEKATVSSVQEGNQETGVIVLDREAQEKGRIEVETVQLRQVDQSITSPGQLTVNEDRTWRVGAVASGKVDELLARVGDSVHEGQPLARIHSHDVHDVRAAYQEASVELERARAAERYAKRFRDRASRLFELKAGSRQDLESADAEFRNAQAQIDKAQAELEKERVHLTEFLRVPIQDGPHQGENEHNHAEDDIPVFAPASGIVLERKPTIGSVVTAGDVLFSISDTSSLWMIAAANEADLSKIHPGEPVRVLVRAYPELQFSARILKLGEQLDPTTRTLQIRLLVPNSKGLLKPEMFAEAAMDQPSRRAAMFLPEAAVQEINGVPAIFVRRAADQFEPRTIKTGDHINGVVEIVQGLNAGDSVVVRGSFLLKSQMLKSSIAE